MKRNKILIPAFVCLLSLFVLLSGTQAAFAYETVSVNIPVNCLEVYGNRTHTYDLRMESADEESPEPVRDILTMTEDSTGAFEIDLTEPGTYHYSIYEIAGSDADIRYDSRRYNLTVYAENNESGGLVCSIIAYSAGADRKAERIAFQDEVISVETTTASTVMTTASSAASAVTTDTTAATAKQTTSINIVKSILTGDSFPAHAIRLVMLTAAMTAIFAFLFKREQSEEDEKSE